MVQTHQNDTGYWMLDKDTNWIHTSSIKYQASSICPHRDAEFRSLDRKHRKLITFILVHIDMLYPRFEKEGAQLYLLLVRGKADQKLLFTGHPFQALYVL